MNYLLGYLPDDYLREIARYYSQLQPPYPAPVTGASGAVLARGEALVMKGDASRNLPACRLLPRTSTTRKLRQW